MYENVHYLDVDPDNIIDPDKLDPVIAERFMVLNEREKDLVIKFFERYYGNPKIKEIVLGLPDPPKRRNLESIDLAVVAPDAKIANFFKDVIGFYTCFHMSDIWEPTRHFFPRLEIDQRPGQIILSGKCLYSPKRMIKPLERIARKGYIFCNMAVLVCPDGDKPEEFRKGKTLYTLVKQQDLNK
ncbi:hypothetical protein KY337_05000 [Candidatus Woesearchaeota archaeon]|nr:hypothetical protein [Candidatus Woesearchaeota archaeon]